MLDLAIVGAGPAGLSAGLVARANGLGVRVFDAAPAPGGQLRWADNPIDDLLGRPAADGPALIEALAAHARAAGVPLSLGAPVRAVAAEGEGFVVTTEDGAQHPARAAVLATGTRPRSLGWPDEHRRARRPPPEWRGARVVVIGGGDEAVTTAVELSRHDVQVTLVVRGTPRARPRFWAEALASPAVEVLLGERVVAVDGARVALASGATREAVQVLTRVGVEVVAPALRPAPRRHEDGRFVTDERRQTSVPGLYAAGDCAVTASARYAAVAIAHGVEVARAVEERLGR